MNAQSEMITRTRRPVGSVAIDELARVLLVTNTDLAAATGLSKDSVWRASRAHSANTQKGVSELVGILQRVAPWTGHPRIAFAWYRSQQLPGFGSMTAEDLLKMDRSRVVEAYLDRIADGGFA